ncbi:MAG: hypothetical protein IRZ21_12015 [Thermoleophilaceae bacterium]|nr:hypothetical protein [Thermoleophilaceae bacterium]
MKAVVLDLVHDLRKKRLLPVAGLLVVALVAIPVLLRKDGDAAGTSAAPVTAPAPGASRKPVVTRDTDLGSSRLSAFHAKDPFKGPRPAAAPSSASGSQASAGGPASAPSPSSGGAAGGSPQAPSRDGGTAPSAGGGGGGQGQPSQPKREAYTYVVDLRFGKRGSVRTHHEVKRLDVLPSDRRPLVVFLGVDSTRGRAVFLLDSTLKADGEGHCKPSSKVCTFLYLKPDKDHDRESLVQTGEGGSDTGYALRLLKIRRVPLSEVRKKPSKEAARRAAERARRLRKRGAVPFHLLFALPRFADEVR